MHKTPNFSSCCQYLFDQQIQSDHRKVQIHDAYAGIEGKKAERMAIMTFGYDRHQSNYLPICLKRFSVREKFRKQIFSRCAPKEREIFLCMKKAPKIERNILERLGVCDEVESLTPKFHFFDWFLVTAMEAMKRLFRLSED